jgi:hypothetical protein
MVLTTRNSAMPSAALPAAMSPKAQPGIVTCFCRDFPRLDKRSILFPAAAKRSPVRTHVAFKPGESKACRRSLGARH